MFKTSFLAFTAIVGLGLGACAEDAPPPDEVRARITSGLGHILREASAAVEGGVVPVPGAASLAMLERVLGVDSGIAVRARTVIAMLAARGRRGGVRPADEPYNPDADLALLNDKLFSDANHAGDGVYPVPVALVCSEISLDMNGNEFQSIDRVCAGEIARIGLQVRVRESGDELRFTLRADTTDDEPLTIALTHDRLSLTLVLEEAMHVAEALAARTDEVRLDFALAGELTAVIEILGTAHAKASLVIDRHMSLGLAPFGKDPGGPGGTRFTLAQLRLLAVELDGAAKRGSVVVDAGEASAHVVGARNTDADGDELDLDLTRLTAVATFGADEPLALTHVDLGPAIIRINGERAMFLQLSGDPKITRDPVTGREHLDMRQSLELELVLDHAVLGNAPPVYDIKRVRIEGEMLVDEAGGPIEVVDGRFYASATPAEYGFSAGDGECITSNDVELPDGRSYVAWAVGACP